MTDNYHVVKFLTKNVVFWPRSRFFDHFRIWEDPKLENWVHVLMFHHFFLSCFCDTHRKSNFASLHFAIFLRIFGNVAWSQTKGLHRKRLIRPYGFAGYVTDNYHVVKLLAKKRSFLVPESTLWQFQDLGGFQAWKLGTRPYVSLLFYFLLLWYTQKLKPATLAKN